MLGRRAAASVLWPDATRLASERKTYRFRSLDSRAFWVTTGVKSNLYFRRHEVLFGISVPFGTAKPVKTLEIW